MARGGNPPLFQSWGFALMGTLLDGRRNDGHLQRVEAAYTMADLMLLEREKSNG